LKRLNIIIDKIKWFYNWFITTLILTSLLVSCSKSAPEISGEWKVWHTLTLTFDGPETSEQSVPNPFLDYRLIVEFYHGNTCYRVRGFYAADGNAAETGADSGKKWQVRFTPNQEGKWRYAVLFRQGRNISINDTVDSGKPVSFDGMHGTFMVGPTDKTGKDFRGKGRLIVSGERYFQHAGTGQYFLKGGADSPENFLAFTDFDGTYYAGNNKNRMGEANPNTNLHSFSAHIHDWKTGDPVWKNNKGKGIIGALNYLSSKGINSIYFLTLNIGGDGQDVWPYADYNDHLRFDCSKLDQWEIVFSHMDKLGILMHVVTQENENQLLLDNGNTSIERRLYYLELISRFGHHLAINWNMGEENGYADFSPNAQTTEQQRQMIKYMKEHDVYKNPVVLHTHSNPKYRNMILDSLLGFDFLNGLSLQIGNLIEVHAETLTLINKSKQTGSPWTVCIDEIGPASRGVDPDDKIENNQDSIRSYVLWANLMAGGGGAEWYFGYENHDNDLNCEDFRSRDRMWDYTRIALDFFRKYLPYQTMQPADSITDNQFDYCLAKPGGIYAIYLPFIKETRIELSKETGLFEVLWYNPRKGNGLLPGSVRSVQGGQKQLIGQPPESTGSDWVALITKMDSD
jgi:hypothetical protein